MTMLSMGGMDSRDDKHGAPWSEAAGATDDSVAQNIIERCLAEFLAEFLAE
jgi:hypothetical protein